MVRKEEFEDVEVLMARKEKIKGVEMKTFIIGIVIVDLPPLLCDGII